MRPTPDTRAVVMVASILVGLAFLGAVQPTPAAAPVDPPARSQRGGSRLPSSLVPTGAPLPDKMAARPTSPHPAIQGMMDRVLSTTVATYDQQLSGARAITVDGASYMMRRTRYMRSGTIVTITRFGAAGTRRLEPSKITLATSRRAIIPRMICIPPWTSTILRAW